MMMMMIMMAMMVMIMIDDSSIMLNGSVTVWHYILITGLHITKALEKMANQEIRSISGNCVI